MFSTEQKKRLAVERNFVRLQNTMSRPAPTLTTTSVQTISDGEETDTMDSEGEGGTAEESKQITEEEDDDIVEVPVVKVVTVKEDEEVQGPPYKKRWTDRLRCNKQFEVKAINYNRTGTSSGDALSTLSTTHSEPASTICRAYPDEIVDEKQ